MSIHPYEMGVEKVPTGLDGFSFSRYNRTSVRHPARPVLLLEIRTHFTKEGIMTTYKSEKGGPHNIPIRIYGTGKSKEEEAEYRALVRDVRALVDEAVRRGVIHTDSWKKSKKARRLMAWAESMDWHGLIEVNPDIAGGRAIIKGTRVPVWLVAGVLGAGDTIAEVCRRYRISRAAVRAALSYAAESLNSVPAERR